MRTGPLRAPPAAGLLAVRIRTAAWKWTIVDCGPGYDRISGNNPWLVEWRSYEKSIEGQ